jgi:hypothetical protein
MLLAFGATLAIPGRRAVRAAERVSVGRDEPAEARRAA